MKIKFLSIAGALLAMTSLSGPAALAHPNHTNVPIAVAGTVGEDTYNPDFHANDVAGMGSLYVAPVGSTISYQNGVLTWSVGGKVDTVEDYYRHGYRDGRIKLIHPTGSSAMVTSNRLTIKVGGRYIFIACEGGDDNLILRGLKRDCTLHDRSGRPAGALVIDGSAT